MTHHDLEDSFASLELAPDAFARIEAAALASYDASQQSLTAEWVDLLRVRPALNGALTLAAALALLVVSPLGALLLALLRRE